jgi:NhaP-type Na+/H+ or K+/H+ antiporter
MKIMFDNVTSRYDLSDATIEITIMLLVAFLLGALLGYLLCKQRKGDEKGAKPPMPSNEAIHPRAIPAEEASVVS